MTEVQLGFLASLADWNTDQGGLQQGDLVEYDGKIYLVGDTNALGGWCECCAWFSIKIGKIDWSKITISVKE